MDRNGESYWSTAQDILDRLFENRMGSSETYGLAGGVAKRRATSALREEDLPGARAHLRRSIDYYEQGMDAEPSDFYVGINLVSLSRLYIQHISYKDEYRRHLDRRTPVVEFYVDRARGRGTDDFWAEVSKAELTLTRFLNEAKSLSSEDVVDAYFEALAVPHPVDWETSVRDQLELFRLAGDPIELVNPVLDRLQT